MQIRLDTTIPRDPRSFDGIPTPAKDIKVYKGLSAFMGSVAVLAQAIKAGRGY